MESLLELKAIDIAGEKNAQCGGHFCLGVSHQNLRVCSKALCGIGPSTLAFDTEKVLCGYFDHARRVFFFMRSLIVWSRWPQWPQWDTLFVDVDVLDSSAKKGEAEMVERYAGRGGDGRSLDLVRACLKRKFKTPEHAAFARSGVINGAVTEENFHKYGWS